MTGDAGENAKLYPKNIQQMDTTHVTVNACMAIVIMLDFLGAIPA
jgi:hypothetical protein